MTADLAAAVRRLVAGDSPSRVAAAAVQACEQLSRHLARLIGELGTRTLLARCATLTSARFPWFAGAIPRVASVDAPWAALSTALESQDPQVAREAFVDLWSTFIGLLEQLIGDRLVASLLYEGWPQVFPKPVEGAT